MPDQQAGPVGRRGAGLPDHVRRGAQPRRVLPAPARAARADAPAVPGDARAVAVRADLPDRAGRPPAPRAGDRVAAGPPARGDGPAASRAGPRRRACPAPRAHGRRSRPPQQGRAASRRRWSNGSRSNPRRSRRSDGPPSSSSPPAPPRPRGEQPAVRWHLGCFASLHESESSEVRHAALWPHAGRRRPASPGAARHLWWRVRDYASVLRWQAGQPARVGRLPRPRAARRSARRARAGRVGAVAVPASGGRDAPRARCAGARDPCPRVQPTTRRRHGTGARSVPRRARPARRRAGRAQQGWPRRQARHAAARPAGPDRVDGGREHAVLGFGLRALDPHAVGPGVRAVRRDDRRAGRRGRGEPPDHVGPRVLGPAHPRRQPPGRCATTWCWRRRGTSGRWPTRSSRRSCWTA